MDGMKESITFLISGGKTVLPPWIPSPGDGSEVTKQQTRFFFLLAGLVAAWLLIMVVARSLSRQAAPAPTTVPTVRLPTIAVTSTPNARNTTTRDPSTATAAVPSAYPAPADSLTPQPSPTEFSLVPTPSIPGGKNYFAAPDGSKENDGSAEHPWELQYVFNHPERIEPGDTIWLLGGEYRGSYTLRLDGEAERPITVRAVPGQRAILMNNDLVLDISTSSYVNLWGLEITATENNRDPVERKESAYGVRINQGRESHHIKFINMIVHDMPAQGFGWWRANSDSEIYGSLVFYNGVNQFDHGIYVMNDKGEKRIVDNFIFDNASHGIHAYGEKPEQALNDIHIEGNTIFNNGSIGFVTTRGVYGKYARNILLGGRNVAQNPVVISNYTYYPGSDGEAFNLGYRAGSTNAVVEDNYFIGGSITLGGDNKSVTVLDNTITGFGLTSIAAVPVTSNQWLFSEPATAKVFVRPNQYEPGRANITIYNWVGRDQVAITPEDLAEVGIRPGDAYRLHNVQDYFSDIITGVYDGSQILVPMTGRTVAQPLGLDFKPASTFPDFGAFVLFVEPAN